MVQITYYYIGKDAYILRKWNLLVTVIMLHRFTMINQHYHNFRYRPNIHSDLHPF
jgi:hypothetical protein